MINDQLTYNDVVYAVGKTNGKKYLIISVVVKDRKVQPKQVTLNYN